MGWKKVVRTVLIVLGGKVADGKPAVHYLLRTDASVEYYKDHPNEEVIFLVSGRWPNVTEQFELNEAEVGKRYIQSIIPDARVIKEDISVELIGNYAFSKPLINALNPDKVIIFTSKLLMPRNSVLAERIFGDTYRFELQIITEDQSDNEVLVEKERNSLNLFNELFKEIPTGEDSLFRDALLYRTPYYFKGIIDDATFFERNWDGGFDTYLTALDVRDKIV